MHATFPNSPNRRKRLILCSFAIFLVIILSLIYFQHSEEAPEVVSTEPSPKNDTSPNQVHHCTQCNPVTHAETEKPKPAKHDMSPLEYAMQRDPRYLTFTTHPDGSQSVHLNGTFRMVTAAKRRPDGTLEIRCFDNYDALQNFTGAIEVK